MLMVKTLRGFAYVALMITCIRSDAYVACEDAFCGTAILTTIGNGRRFARDRERHSC